MELLFPILLVGIAAMLFFQMRKQKKAMQNQQQLQNSLAAGDRIMTTSGLFATVVDTDDDTVDLEIAEGVVTTYLRQAVREKVNAEDDEADLDHTDDADTDVSSVDDEADQTAEADEVAKDASAAKTKK